MTLRVLSAVIGCAVLVHESSAKRTRSTLRFTLRAPTSALPQIASCGKILKRRSPNTMPRWFNYEETSRSELAVFSRPYRISRRSRRNRLSRCGPTKRTLIRKPARWKCEGMFVSTFGTTRSRHASSHKLMGDSIFNPKLASTNGSGLRLWMRRPFPPRWCADSATTAGNRRTTVAFRRNNPPSQSTFPRRRRRSLINFSTRIDQHCIICEASAVTMRCPGRD
jgi:hypothetical protein